VSAFVDLAELDRLVHEPARLGVLATLHAVAEADFVFLRQQTGLSAGNLSSHLTRLESAGYVVVDKQFVDKRPRTVCRLSPQGRVAFDGWRRTMRSLLDGLG
jgi:DNA-binding transcriptional ArsR family regulator